jgi:hypothetical protein
VQELTYQARRAKSERLNSLEEMDVWAAVYASVYMYQVSWCWYYLDTLGDIMQCHCSSGCWDLRCELKPVGRGLTTVDVTRMSPGC